MEQREWEQIEGKIQTADRNWTPSITVWQPNREWRTTPKSLRRVHEVAAVARGGG